MEEAHEIAFYLQYDHDVGRVDKLYSWRPSKWTNNMGALKRHPLSRKNAT